jgi:prepilin-type N-terminal cleavage/methylation domain-containing protein
MMLPKNRKGFTLIELLIVVVIIGILAAIAIPKFANTKEKAYIAAMKSDLKNLVTVQESYFADKQTYAYEDGDPARAVQLHAERSGHAGPWDIVPATGGVGTGWSATMTDTRVTSPGAQKTCGVYTGGAASPNTTAVPAEGVVGCWAP